MSEDLRNSIKVKSSPIQGRGVFAKKDIPEDEKIIEYFGDRITKAESLKRVLADNEKSGTTRTYMFEVNKKIDIDGRVKGNIARYINHSCEPNCIAYNERGKIWIYSLRDIKAGEELYFNYNFPMSGFEHHICLCGSKDCVGYIVAPQYHNRVRKTLERRAAKEALAKKKAVAAEKASTKKRTLRKKKKATKSL